VIFLLLFFTFFKIGLFSIGGGYAMIPLITQELTSNGWASTQQVNDIIAISQMTPGPFALNAATFTGMQMAGIGGAVLATAGVIAPSLIIALIIARFFFRFNQNAVVQGALYGAKPVVAALIASAAILMAGQVFFAPAIGSVPFDAAATLRSLDPGTVLIFTVALFLSQKTKVSPILIVLGAGAVGVLLYAVI
jgi:chromate transporter